MTTLFATEARAQLYLGAGAGFDLNYEDAFVGADLRVAMDRLPFVANATFDYFLVDSDVDDAVGGVTVDQQLMSFGLNGLYYIGIDNTYFTPYAGAGLSLLNSSVDVVGGSSEVSESNWSAGLNLIGGAVFGSGALRPFAQARFTTLHPQNLFSVGGGVLLGIGGR